MPATKRRRRRRRVHSDSALDDLHEEEDRIRVAAEHLLAGVGSQRDSGLVTPIMMPVPLGENVPLRCFPRNGACVVVYASVVVSMVVLGTGLAGVLLELGGESGKCSYWGLVTTITGIYAGAATAWLYRGISSGEGIGRSTQTDNNV